MLRGELEESMGVSNFFFFFKEFLKIFGILEPGTIFEVMKSIPSIHGGGNWGWGGLMSDLPKDTQM